MRAGYFGAASCVSLVADKLTDQDVADLAAYYAAIEVTVKVPK